MFRRTKEMQSLIDSSRKALRIAEQKIAERDVLIRDLFKENKELKDELKKSKEKALVRDYQSNN